MKTDQWLVGVLAALLFVFVSAAAAADGDAARSRPSGGVQTVCPVMEGAPIDRSIFTDYKGKRVYFCCQGCKAKFEASPEQYLAKLPQFGAVDHEGGDEHADDEHHDGAAALAALVKPMGITTLSLVALTVVLGLFRRRSPKLMLTWHKRVGPTALISGVVHAVLVLVIH